MRCPFCQNSDLIDAGLFPAEQRYTDAEVLAFLKKRGFVLEGVAFTGGEPTLQPDLADFMREVRSLGLLIKLDTNGTRPAVLEELFDGGLVDYVAMDIKAARANYTSACGRLPGSGHEGILRIMESASLIMRSGVPYEFRTTTVRGIHTDDDFRDIAEWLAGAQNYYIQSYRDSEQVLERRFGSFSEDELKVFQGILSETMPHVEIRGVS